MAGRDFKCLSHPGHAGLWIGACAKGQPVETTGSSAGFVAKGSQLTGDTRLRSDSQAKGSGRLAARGQGTQTRAYMRRVTRARPLADLIGSSLDKACRRRGFAASDLVADWPDIVGERYAGRVQPTRLDWPRERGDRDDADGQARPATLTVQTDGATALMLTHDMPQVIERINGFFGWAAVGRIRILQRPLTPPRRKVPPRLRALTSAEEAELSDVLRPVEGTALGAALEKLGRAVLAKSR